MLKQKWVKMSIKCKDAQSTNEVAHMLEKYTTVRNITTVKNLVMYEQFSWTNTVEMMEEE